MVQRRLVLVNGKNIHFQIVGAGPAMVMFHPSPHTSNLLVPLAKEFALDYTVICIDTPGYGKSDFLASPPESLGDYTRVIHEFFKKLGIDRPVLYGSATGAQLAIRYALNYPQNVSHIFLDNAAHFEEGFRNKILKHYFPDLSPKQDGSHLPILWKMVNRMFKYFPWCFAEEKYALNKPPLPKEALHFIAMDFLRAGENYYLAYKMAFLHEKAEHVQQLKVPATIFRWKGSIIKKYIDDLLYHDFPEHIKAVSVPADNVERVNEMIKQIRGKSRDLPGYILPSEFDIEPDFLDEIKGNIPSNKLPAITADGTYLLDTWALLKRDNVGYAPKDLQELMLKWFTTN